MARDSVAAVGRAVSLALFAAPYAAVREWPTLWLWLAMIAVAALFAWSASEGRAGRLMRWAVTGVAALGLFAVTLIAGVLPSIDKIWPAREVQRALASCAPGGSACSASMSRPRVSS